MADLRPDRMIGERYALESRLGEGGMGEVWQARHNLLGHKVAVKLLHPNVIQRPGARERFLREAQVMARLTTRRAVAVFDFGIMEDGAPYLVMEFVEGETLAEKIVREGRLSPLTTVKILSHAARGLEQAHAAGIVHCDFKTDNVLIAIDEDGGLDVKVADFGVARFIASSGEDELAGTPSSMAPEQLRGENGLTTAVDVWAFGVVAYEALTGVLPFPGRNVLAISQSITAKRWLSASAINSRVPAAFDGWFERACAPAPENRFQSIRAAAEELAFALEQSSPSPGPIPSQSDRWRLPAGRALVGVACILGGAGVVGAFSRAELSPAAESTLVTPLTAEPSRNAPSPSQIEPQAPPGSAVPLHPAPLSLTRTVSLPAYKEYPETPPKRPSRAFKADPY